MSFGHTSGGWLRHEHFRPTIQAFSDTVCAARDVKANPASRAPLPYGWDFDLARSSFLLGPSAEDYVRYVKAFGFLAHIHDNSADDTPSPISAVAVSKLPYRFGTKDSELLPSWSFARITAFAAKADFPKKNHFAAFPFLFPFWASRLLPYSLSEDFGW